jgi:hypothetical protein
VGAYRSLRSPIDIDTPAGTVRGKMDLIAAPVTAALSRYQDFGFLRGKAGLGLTVYGFTGEIDVPDSPQYEDRGGALNLAVPVELIAHEWSDGSALRFDLNWQVPLVKTDFGRNQRDQIENVVPFGGLFVGLTYVVPSRRSSEHRSTTP